MGKFKSEKRSTNNPRRKMALYINTFSPFSMRSPFDDAFFKSSWDDGWMIPSRGQNPFKEFQTMFNEEGTKVDEDETKMEVRINASEYKPEELKVSVQSRQLLVEGKHEEKKKDGSAYVKRVSRGVTPFPRRLRRTRWSPNSPPRVSSSSPHPRVHLLSPMKHQKKINLMKSQKKSKFYVLCFYVSNISKLKYNFSKI